VLALFLVLALAAAAAIALTPLVIRMASRWGVLDTPLGDRRVHTEPLPRLGGIAVFAAMCVGLLALVPALVTGVVVEAASLSFFFGVLFGGAIIFVIGLVDDIRGLRPSTKLAAQILAALVVYAYGFRIDVLSLTPNTELTLGWMALPLTILWIVGITNAFNLIDGLDGLATGIAMVALTTTLAVAAVLGNWEVVLLSGALVGALGGFLRYNFNPARIFLGDSGSLFIGFMLAVLSVYGSQKSAAAVLVIIPLFALAIPLLDTLLAILRRWLRGVHFFEADARHIHHRLLALGLTHRHAVMTLYLVATVLALLGITLVFAPPAAVFSIAAAGGGSMLIFLLYGLGRLQYHEFVEAGAVMAGGVSRARRIIRDQIHARDVSAVVALAKSIDELSAIIQDNATTFGFLHMEVCRESANGTRPLVVSEGKAMRALKLDYPVTPHDFEDGDDHVLRIWSNPRSRGETFSAERVARILAPVIEERMLEFGPLLSQGRMQGEHAGELLERVSATIHRPASPLVVERGSSG
jgi:UDP-GlcNAc:undecaprenyl-phosphate/decaprenyl-phosphate GlcNAc-1-phosphate transferase